MSKLEQTALKLFCVTSPSFCFFFPLKARQGSWNLPLILQWSISRFLASFRQTCAVGFVRKTTTTSPSIDSRHGGSSTTLCNPNMVLFPTTCFSQNDFSLHSCNNISTSAAPTDTKLSRLVLNNVLKVCLEGLFNILFLA